MKIDKYKKPLEYLISVNRKELGEIYNALCCLNIAIRDDVKQGGRIKFVRKLISVIDDARKIRELPSWVEFCRCDLCLKRTNEETYVPINKQLVLQLCNRCAKAFNRYIKQKSIISRKAGEVKQDG